MTKYTDSELKLIEEIMRKGVLTPEIKGDKRASSKDEEENLKPKSAAFGNGLVAKRDGQRNSYTIYNKFGAEVGHTEYCPVGAFEDSGCKYFLCTVNGGKNRRFMDADGVFCFEEFGAHTASFTNGYARIERKDGTYGFINLKGQDIGLVLADATNFVYKIGNMPVAEARFVGAKHRCYINPKGEIVNTKRFSSQAYLDEIGDSENATE